MFRYTCFFILFYFGFGNFISAYSQEQTGEIEVVFSKKMQPNDSISVSLFDSIKNEKCIGFFASDTTQPAFIYQELNGNSSLITFWENGNTKKSESYKKGISNGNYFLAYENGSLEEKGNYKNGKKNRIWKYWNTDGILEKEDKFDNGKLLQSFDKNNFSSLKLSKFGIYFSGQTSYFNLKNLNTELNQNGFKTISPTRMLFGGGFLYGNKKNFFVSMDVAIDFLANSQTPYYRTVSGTNYTFCLNKIFLEKHLWSLIVQAGMVNVQEKFNFYSSTGVAFENSLANYIGNGTLKVENNWILKTGFDIDMDKKIFFPKANNENTGTSAFINAGIYLPISNPHWEDGNRSVTVANPIVFYGFYLGIGLNLF
ncbi:MAG TPA: hypothetical protein VNG53_07855 [Bacteroidia bacterium]|nr:hypothetical protein [Bacteroidia bacterium]